MPGLLNVRSVSFQNASLWFAGAFRTGRRIVRVWSRFCCTLGWWRLLRISEICMRKAILSQAFKSWRTLDSIQKFPTHCLVFTLDLLNSSCWLLDSSLFIFVYVCFVSFGLGNLCLKITLDRWRFTLWVKKFPTTTAQRNSGKRYFSYLLLIIYLFSATY